MTRAERRRLSDYALGTEAALCAALARVAIRFIPFRHLARMFTRPPAWQDLTGAVRKRAIADVRWAIRAAATRLPGSTSCFARAVAAQAMLRRRGVSTTLLYGATAAEGRGLRAHVWLRAGHEDIVGGETARGYVVIAAYSDTGAWIKPARGYV